MPLTFCTESLCYFDKTPTPFILFFELIILLGTFLFFKLFKNRVKHIYTKYFVMCIGILIFELFTAPMWNNHKLGSWAYIYGDVSWVLTIGWATLISSIVFTIDIWFKKLTELKKTLLFVGVITPVIMIFELLTVVLGIRSYAPEVLNSSLFVLYPLRIPLFDSLYYIPVFILLIVTFYKYWSFYIDNKALVPLQKQHIWKNLIITFIGVFMYEIVIEPMVVNAHFPAWSYIFKDISIILSGFWIVLIWVAVYISEKYFIHLELPLRFAIALIICALIATPFEAWLIKEGFRVYGTSAELNFSGFNTLIFKVPIEVMFAIPSYLALVISFVRYWDIVKSNDL